MIFLNKLRKEYLWIVLIVLLAIFLRFYQLGFIPAGLLNDEANSGYDAYSLLLTAKDQWGTFLPISNFKGFGDYPPPIYRYLSIIPIAVFGLSEFSVRFASAAFGALSVIAVYFLVKKFFDKKAAIFASLFFAILPWSIGLSRVAIESNVAIFFMLISLLTGLKPKSEKYLYVSAIFLGLSTYIYSAYILYAPLVLLVILIYNYRDKIKLQSLVKPIIIFVVILGFLFIQKNTASVRFSQIGLTNNINSIGLINVLNDQRGQCIKSVNPLVCKVLENKAWVFTGTFTKNYLAHFSSNLLYINGSVTQFSILPQRGLDYLFNSIFLILGIYYVLKTEKHRKIGFTLLILFLLSTIPDSLTGDGNFSRGSIMQPFIVIFDGLGLYYLLFHLNINRHRFIKYSLVLLIPTLITLGVVSFYVNYLTYFKNNYSIYSQYGYKDLVAQVTMNKQNFDKIYISRHLNDTKQYIYFLFYNKYDPIKFQNKNDISYSQQSDGWYSVDKIENIYFVQTSPSAKDLQEMSNEKVLIISNPIDFPEEIKPAFVVKDKLNNVLFKAVNSKDLLEYEKRQRSLRLTNGNI